MVLAWAWWQLQQHFTSSGTDCQQSQDDLLGICPVILGRFGAEGLDGNALDSFDCRAKHEGSCAAYPLLKVC